MPGSVRGLLGDWQSYRDSEESPVKIIDPDNILRDQSALIKVIQGHPFSATLCRDINSVTIEEPLEGQCISVSLKDGNVTLFIYRDTQDEDNFHHVLYHEFGHVADRFNPSFRYSKEQRDALSCHERENLIELWNVYIDARLNRARLFQLPTHGQCAVRVEGKLRLVPHSIETKLCMHANFLSSRNFQNASDVVDHIWKNPEQFLSFQDMLDLVKSHTT